MADIRFMIVSLLPRLRGFALALSRSSDAADDLVQATCEKALRASDSWTPGTRLDSWMFRIMQNHWIDERRKKKPHESIDEEEHQNVTGDDGARITEARLTLDTVRELVEAMPDEQRSVLILVCVEEMSYREAADVLEVPIGTIMSRLSRARRALIEAMEENKAGRRAGASGDGS